VTTQNSLSSAAVQSALFDVHEIRAQAERLLASRTFTRSSRLTRFLRFCVEQTVLGNASQLKEQRIGIEVFDREQDYDPRIDPIVRVEARRLRAKLKSYYSSAGRGDPILIGLPKGSYVPVFRARAGARAKAAADPEERSVVVLPFENLTPGAEDDYFSDGLAEELIHLLTRIPNLRVVAWTSASQLRGRSRDLSGIRRQLKVGAVLCGSVRKTPERVRVTAQLIDTESGDYLWSGAYDRQMQDVFAIQEEMARAIVDALQLTLSPPRKADPSRASPNLECYNLCLQGRFHGNQRTREGLLKSVACFERAIAADDCSAVAYAGLADTYSLLADYGFLDPGIAVPKARVSAEKALALDPQSTEANVSLAFVRSLFDWEWAEAEVLYRRAIQLNPGYSRARHWFGLDFLALLDRLDEAMPQLEMAHSLDPLSQIIQEGCGYLYVLRREYTKAVETYLHLIEMDPAFYKAYSSLGRALFMMKRYDEAILAFEKSRELAGPIPSILGALGHTLACAGRVKEARVLLGQLFEMSRTQWVPSACFAVLHLGLNDFENALTALETACDRREMAVTALRVHPMYDPLRSEPRFRRLLQQIKLLP
jgi:TolB-like protein/tetratricopeptide (TPR) repeat protein